MSATVTIEPAGDGTWRVARDGELIAIDRSKPCARSIAHYHARHPQAVPRGPQAGTWAHQRAAERRATQEAT